MDSDEEWKRKVEEQLLRDYYGLLTPEPTCEVKEEDYVWLEECEDQLYEDYCYGRRLSCTTLESNQQSSATMDKNERCFPGRLPLTRPSPTTPTPPRTDTTQSSFVNKPIVMVPPSGAPIPSSIRWK